jgi:UDP:flavonoid glycosyltransferase YjiC (YdhE family)
MLIVPYGWDQPDNAARIARLGVGLNVARSHYSVNTAIAALKSILESPRISARAADVGYQVAAEDGLGSACDAIESINRSTSLAKML